MRKIISFLLVIAALLGFSYEVSAEESVVIRFGSGATGKDIESTKHAAKLFEGKNPGVKIEISTISNSPSDQYAFLMQMMEAKSDDVDVFQIDVTWPGDLAENLIDLNKYGAKKLVADFFPKMIQNNTLKGKLVAMPWFTDAGLLYFRTDLLKKYKQKAPKTWPDLMKAAAIIQRGERKAGKSDFVGYVWEGEAYEGLTCNALEWIYSNGGGTIISNNRFVTINNSSAIAAVNMAAAWVGTISPRGVTSMKEEDARAVFQDGNAALMRNWPYAYELAQNKDSKIKGKVGISPMPAGKTGKHADTLGGWQLSVNKYSKNPELAAKFVFFMTSYSQQKYRAINAGQYPTRPKVYKNKDVLKRRPLFKQLYPIFESAIARPSTITAPHYNKVSQAFYRSVYSVLTGKSDAESAFSNLAARLSKITGFPVKK